MPKVRSSCCLSSPQRAASPGWLWPALHVWGQPSNHSALPEAATALQQASVHEVSLLSRLKHPNIIGYHDAFLEDGQLCIVMELASGGSLEDELATVTAAVSSARLASGSLQPAACSLQACSLWPAALPPRCHRCSRRAALGRSAALGQMWADRSRAEQMWSEHVCVGGGQSLRVCVARACVCGVWVGGSSPTLPFRVSVGGGSWVRCGGGASHAPR